MRDQVLDLVDAFEMVTVGAAADLLSEWEPGAGGREHSGFHFTREPAAPVLRNWPPSKAPRRTSKTRRSSSQVLADRRAALEREELVDARHLEAPPLVATVRDPLAAYVARPDVTPHHFAPMADDPQTCVHCGGWSQYHAVGGAQ